MESLPNDIIEEIIVWSFDPIKQLRGFRCVCKAISAFLHSDRFWKKILEYIYPWALSTDSSNAVNYRKLVEFIQPPAVDGLQIILTADKDTLKYGESLTLTTTLMNVSATPICLLVGALNLGICFQDGATIEMYLNPPPCTRNAQARGLKRFNSAGNPTITETLISRKDLTYRALCTLTSPYAKTLPNASPIKIKAPMTVDKVCLAIGKALRLYFEDYYYLKLDAVEDKDDRPTKKRKIELPEKFTVYIRHKYDRIYLQNLKSGWSQRLPPGTWDNTAYSNLIPIHIDLSDNTINNNTIQ